MAVLGEFIDASGDPEGRCDNPLLFQSGRHVPVNLQRETNVTLC